MAADVDALLARLVAQFESPYDFLRELVQNAMDAGSDRVEVSLETHAIAGTPDEVVFELSILDTGAGMDEAIIDQELTKLFASGKAGDRTMAGGFGIGFVSVFAWEPEAVLVHTGRGGEAWELLFHADRTFEKVAVDEPLEGTTISLFRRGRPSEREGIAEAVRDSLWRWCRFVPLEIAFEDREGGEPPELIQDAPEPEQAAGLGRAEVRGDTTLRVAFAVPPNAVLLRRGLILAEGGPKQLLGGIATALGPSCDHLQIWADSPLLRTSLARDKVVDDDGRKQIEQRLLAQVELLRGELLARIEALANTGSDVADTPESLALVDPQWTPERHALYTVLHAHLAIELSSVGKQPRTRALLRDLAHGKSISLDAAVERMKGQPLLVGRVTRASEGEHPIAEGMRDLISALRPTTLPVIAADLDDDGPWLRGLAELAGAELVAVERAIARVEPRPNQGVGLCGLIAALLRQLGFEEVGVSLGSYLDLAGRPDANPVFGPEVIGAARPLAFHGGSRVPRASLKRRTIWLNAANLLVVAGIEVFVRQPMLAALALVAGIVGQLDEVPEPAGLIAASEAVAAQTPS
ncbi:ATP-binding protein [Nannocystaceae bacterium ST9]